MRRSSAGRLFHTDGPETENAREVRVRTVMAALVDDDLRRLLPGSAAVKLIRLVRYDGQRRWKTWCIVTATLNMILNRTM